MAHAEPSSHYVVEKYLKERSSQRSCVASYDFKSYEEAIEYMEFLKSKPTFESVHYDYRVVKITREIVA